MKIQNIRRPIKLFCLSCLFIPIAFSVIGVPFVMLGSIVGLLGDVLRGQTVMYLLWFLLMTYMFYGGSKKVNRYLFSLEKGKQYTLWDDFRLFLSEEGIAVMGAYAVYAVLCFLLSLLVPKTDHLLFNMLNLTYSLPIFPRAFVPDKIWLEYLVSLTSFCVIYMFAMMWKRARIRKKWL